MARLVSYIAPMMRSVPHHERAHTVPQPQKCYLCVGVDFSTRHFDKLYVYACLMSTSPHGLMQMTGRIRHLGDSTVLCCAAPSISFRPKDPSPKILALEQLQFLRWVEKKVGGTGGSINTELHRVEGGGEMLLPLDDAAAYAFAANEAERINGQTRFFLELQHLMQEAGHIVVINDEAKVEAPSHDLSVRKQWLLHGRNISEDEYATMQNNIVRRQASEEEKWLAYRFEYMEAWGLCSISEEFIAANGTRCGCLKLSRLRRLLQPAATRYCIAERELTPAQKQDIMRIGAVEEVIEALGLSGPFDTAHTVEDIASGEVNERLLNTECFKTWNDMRKVFSSRIGKVEDWKLTSIRTTIGSILDSIGLRLVRTKRVREKCEDSVTTTYQYRLSPDDVTTMRELLALKDGNVEGSGRWKDLVPPPQTCDIRPT